MKKLYFAILFSLVIQFSFASPIKAVTNNGYWKTTSTWDKNRAPKNGDTVVIPVGKTILVNSWEVLNSIYIQVYGTLKFTGFLTGLSMDASSKIMVYDGARIQTTISYFQYLIIGSTYLLYEGQVAGPIMGTSAGFTAFNPLPVQFISFTALLNNSSEVLLQWSTAQEVGVGMYEVERSLDGNSWTTIAFVPAVGGSAENHYSYKDKNFSFAFASYRIKEVDVNGKANYTSVATIKTAASVTGTAIRISAYQNRVVLQFPESVKGRLVVRFLSLNGQLVDQRVVSGEQRQVVIESKLTGNYIISVTNGQDVHTAKQMIL